VSVVKTALSLAARTDSILVVKVEEKKRHGTNSKHATCSLSLGVDWNSLVLELA
jgi:hypothetical protein